MPITPWPARQIGLAPPGAASKGIVITRAQALAPPGLSTSASPDNAKLLGLCQPDFVPRPNARNGKKEQILKPLSQGAFLIGP